MWGCYNADFFLLAKNRDRSFSVAISPATIEYNSSTDEQRSAARFTTTLAMGPIYAANSRLTESRSADCSLLDGRAGSLPVRGAGVSKKGFPLGDRAGFAGATKESRSMVCASSNEISPRSARNSAAL